MLPGLMGIPLIEKPTVTLLDTGVAVVELGPTSLSFNVVAPYDCTLLIAWNAGIAGTTTAAPVAVTVDGVAATEIGSDFSYTGTSANLQLTIGFHRIAVSAGTRAIVITYAGTGTENHVAAAVWAMTGYTSYSKTGFNRSNSNTLSSSISASPGNYVIGYSAWKNPTNANGYYHSAATLEVNAALSSATVTGTLGTTGRDWSGTAGLTEVLEEVLDDTSSTNDNYCQSFLVLS